MSSCRILGWSPGAGIRALRGRGERGSATIQVAVWAAALSLLAAGGIALTTVWAARESVATGADLAALAGASATTGAPGLACERARSAADRNGVTVRSCRVSGTDVWVTVSAPPPEVIARFVPGRLGALHARAHASLEPGVPGW